jgi:Fic family protein
MMPGHAVAVPWEGRTVDAWVPERLADLPLPASAAVARSTERAASAVRRLGDRSTGSLEAAARLLLRAEGLASSAIEGLRVRPEDLALAAAGARSGDEVVVEVAANLDVLTTALAVEPPLGAEDLLAWQARLLAEGRLPPELVGAWRDRVGWVGGANPLLAAHVGAPPALVGELVDDLVAFVARTDVDPLTQAAVAHAQFETIHPFADGNGRIGRVLVGWLLVHRLAVPVPPPVSLAFARDVGGYLSGLTLFRQGDVDRWVVWFADAVERIAERTVAVLDEVRSLVDRWVADLADLRADAAARRIVPDLVDHPVLTSSTVADRLGTTATSARTALELLADRGILTPIDGPAVRPTGRPPRWYAASEVLALLGG